MAETFGVGDKVRRLEGYYNSPFRVMSVSDYPDRCNCGTMNPLNHNSWCNLSYRRRGIKKIHVGQWNTGFFQADIPSTKLARWNGR